MTSLEVASTTLSLSCPPSSLSDRLLASEGLRRDPKQLPLFSLWELFETLLKQRKISRQAIRRKIVALLDFLGSEEGDRMPDSLKRHLLQNSTRTEECLQDDSLFFNGTVLHLFSLAFGLRLELFHANRGRLSAQYFGLKGQSVRQALLTEDSFVVLKRAFKRTVELSADPLSRGISPRHCTNKANSFKTVATRLTEGGDSIHLELNRCTSVNTGISNEKDSYNTINKLDFGTEKGGLNEAANEYLESASRGSQPSDQWCSPYGADPQSPTFHFGAQTPAQSFAGAFYESPRSLTQNSLSELPSPPKYPFTLSQGKRDEGKAVGRLKFFNEAKEYGFIIMDDESEIFVHKADLLKQNIDTRYLAYYKKYYEILMEFNVQEYQGKAKKHRKAVDVLIYDMQALC